MKAWLITWDVMGEVRPVADVAAVLNPPWSEERVRKHTERLYAELTASPDELLAYVRTQGAWPYRAEYHHGRGLPFMGRILCGHNPALYARKVEKLRLESDDVGNPAFVWQEIPIPPLPIGVGMPQPVEQATERRGRPPQHVVPK